MKSCDTHAELVRSLRLIGGLTLVVLLVLGLWFG